MTKELYDAIKNNEVIKKYGLDKEIKAITDGEGLINIDSYDYIDLLKNKTIAAVVNGTYNFGERIDVIKLINEDPTMGIVYIEANQGLTIEHLEEVVAYIREKVGGACDLIYSASINKELPDNKIKLVFIASK